MIVPDQLTPAPQYEDLNSRKVIHLSRQAGGELYGVVSTKAIADDAE